MAAVFTMHGSVAILAVTMVAILAVTMIAVERNQVRAGG